jgi:hypothetical protein
LQFLAARRFALQFVSEVLEEDDYVIRSTPAIY